jgi:uncharacterized membrane protein HdeD (DUF308 family)
MSFDPQSVRTGVAAASEHELRHLQREWFWFVLLGALLLLAGLLAIIYPAVSTLAAVIVLGMSLLVSGAATLVLAFWTGRWNAFLLQLLCGLLYVVVGFLIMDAPGTAALSLTVIVAAMFLVIGLVRAVAALVLRFPQWGWSLLSGVITALLGLVIYKAFASSPGAALALLGTLIGVELIFSGWYWIMLGIAVNRLPGRTT